MALQFLHLIESSFGAASESAGCGGFLGVFGGDQTFQYLAGWRHWSAFARQLEAAFVAVVSATALRAPYDLHARELSETLSDDCVCGDHGLLPLDCFVL